MLSAQCIRQLDTIWQLSLSFHHPQPIDLTLIIAVNGLSQLNIGRLGMHGFKLIGHSSQIGII